MTLSRHDERGTVITTGTDIRTFAQQFGITLMNDAQVALSPRLRDLHRAILSAFIDSGHAPTVSWIADRATTLDLDPADALSRLADADLVHCADGSVTVAYPFSGVPTPHRVQLDCGTASWAMCGGDALGIPLMTGRDATITSTDPQTGEPIRIRRHDTSWQWEPPTTVMLAAAISGCGTAAEAGCGYVHFFTRAEHAETYLQAHPNLGGEIYDQPAAIKAARIIFGPLLDESTALTRYCTTGSRLVP